MKRKRSLNKEKRESILKAAISEFYERGYESSSMDIVAKNANVSKATIYNHFENKEELFFAITDIFMNRFKKAFDFTYNKNKGIKEQLLDIAKKEISFLSYKENITLIQIVTAILIQKNEIGVKLLNQTCKDSEINIIMTKNFLEEAKKDGKLFFDDSEFVARQFIGMIKSFAFYPQLYGAPLLQEKQKNELIVKSVHMILTLYKSN